MKVKLLLSVCLCILSKSKVYGDHTQFFRNTNFTGLIKQSNIQAGCNKIPNFAYYQFDSVVTDKCIFLYLDDNCKSLHIQMVGPGNNTLSFDGPESYLKCIENHERFQLNIDVVKPYRPYTRYHFDKQMVLASHRNVCSCVNIPGEIQQLEFWAIRSYDNEYVAYFETDCTETRLKPKHVIETYAWLSEGKISSDGYAIKSIGPAKNTTYYDHKCILGDKISRLEHSTTNLNNTQTSILAAIQKQNNDIRMLEKKLNESELKLEDYQFNFTEKLKKFQEDFTAKLVNIMDELDDDDKFRS